jgi:cystathionine beta-lyase family protein involved in aluminum resistance
MSNPCWARDQLDGASARIAPFAERHTAGVQPRLERVLAALAAERVGVQHFASVSGYGHGD